MNWKHWPYWLRGGVIAFTIALILIYLDLQCEQSSQRIFTESGGLLDFADIECLTLDWPNWPLQFTIPSSYSLSAIPFIILNSLVWFIVGSFIGSLVGLIKTRKKVTQ